MVAALLSALELPELADVAIDRLDILEMVSIAEEQSATIASLKQGDYPPSLYSQ